MEKIQEYISIVVPVLGDVMFGVITIQMIAIIISLLALARESDKQNKALREGELSTKFDLYARKFFIYCLISTPILVFIFIFIVIPISKMVK